MNKRWRNHIKTVFQAVLCVLTFALLPLQAGAVSPPPGTVLENVATAIYTDANGNTEYVDAVSSELFPLAVSASVQNTIGGAALLEIYKLESNDPVAPGGSLTYTIYYRNTGNITATDVTVDDTLSDFLFSSSASNGGIFTSTPAGDTVSWNIGDLEAGEYGAVTILTRVKNAEDYPPGDPQAISNGAMIPNTASISADGVEGQSTHITTTVNSAPNLIINKFATAGTVQPGGHLTYIITYQNIGNQQATNARIRDSLPEGVAYVAGSLLPSGSIEDRVIQIGLGTINPGEEGEVNFQVQVSPIAPEGFIIRNQAIITCDQLGSIVSNQTVNQVAATTTTPSIIFTKLDNPDPAYVGNPVVYTLEITNDGTAPLSGIEVRDPIPAQTTFVDADNGGSCINDSSNNCIEVVWQIDGLAAGETKSLLLTVLVNPDIHEGSVITNQAIATANETPYPSPVSTTTVSARTPGIIEFYDEDWNETSTYDTGEGICLQVTDLDQNTDSAAVEEITIVITHEQSGDLEEPTLLETGPDTGIFRTCISSSGMTTGQNDGTISVSEDTVITATYTDELDASPVSKASALIDPFGIVFDSITGQPVAGAITRLEWNDSGSWVSASTHPLWPAGQDDVTTTQPSGSFRYPLVPPGTYRIVVIPGGSYGYPSQVLDTNMPAGYIVTTGSRGESFTLSAGDPPLNFDIPVDPPPGRLMALKEANVNQASIGDIVTYTLTLSNNGESAVLGITIQDVLPNGLQYLPDSSKIKGVSGNEPTGTGNLLIWTITPGLAAGETITITYQCVISGSAAKGKAKNIFMASGTSVSQPINSNQASYTLTVREGVFTSTSVILGKVFIDTDNDALQDEDEQGVANVVLYLEDGTRVTTDREGKYSIQGARAGNHVLRLDESTLPPNHYVTESTNRSMGEPSSQFIDLAPGLPFKANFTVNIREAQPVPPETDISVDEDLLIDGKTTEQNQSPSYEEIIKEMTPQLAILTPHGGTTLERHRTNITIKGPQDATIALLVNDIQVPAGKVGKTVVNAEGRIQLVEYISVALVPGMENRITATLTDPFGNLRGSEEISILVAGLADSIQIDSDLDEIPADGVSLVSFTARILDSNDMQLTYPHKITVSSTGGTVVEKDADPSEVGHQVSCNRGIASFHIQAPHETGAATITVLFEDIAAEKEVFFSPHLREMLLVGLGEVAVGSKTDKRGAFFAKGEVSDGFLLTASYDSDKEETDELFRTSDSDLDDEAKYPVLGDESSIGYESQSREKLFVKVEKDKSSMLYGDYATGLNATTLSAYSRSFNGVFANIATQYFTLRGFGARTNQVQVVDTIPGRGISGYYQLTRKNIIEGSERVIIETRDRFRPEHILSRKTKSRFTDYDIDYGMGTLLFKEPVASYDAEWNPIYIIVTYENDSDDEKHHTFGGRAAFRPNEWVEFGVTGITEEKAIKDYLLLGTDMTVNLPLATTIRAEYARTDSLFELDNRLQQKKGHGWHISLEGQPVNGMSLSAYFQNTSDYFGNPSATDASRGKIKYGADLAYGWDDKTVFTATATQEEDSLNNMSYSRLGAGIKRQLTEKTSASFEVYHEESTDDYVPKTSSDSRSPFDISEETPDELTAIQVGFKTRFMEDLSLLLSHKQDIRGNNYSISQVGVDYQINELNRLYVREEYGRFDERDELRTVIGGETKLIKNTVAFNEYRLENGGNGDRNQQILGLRNKFMLDDNFTGNFSLENINTLSGPERTDHKDAFAVTAAAEYLAPADTKFTTRLEYQVETSDYGDHSLLSELGVAQKLSNSHVLLTKGRYFLDRQENDERVTTDLEVGLAYRPTTNDRFNGLAKLDWRHEDGTAVSDTAVDAYILSIEGVFQANSDLQVIGKYAGKYAEQGFSDSYTDMIAGRVLYDLTDRFDLGLEYRLLNSHQTGDLQSGGSIELGCRLLKNLWFSVGYSFDGFDADLTGDYTDEGFFARLRFKLAESSLPHSR